MPLTGMREARADDRSDGRDADPARLDVLDLLLDLLNLDSRLLIRALPLDPPAPPPRLRSLEKHAALWTGTGQPGALVLRLRLDHSRLVGKPILLLILPFPTLDRLDQPADRDRAHDAPVQRAAGRLAGLALVLGGEEDDVREDWGEGVGREVAEEVGEGLAGGGFVDCEGTTRSVGGTDQPELAAKSYQGW